MRRRASFLPPVLLENKTNVFKASSKSGTVKMQFSPFYHDINDVTNIQPEYFREVYESSSSGVLSAINFVPGDTKWEDYEIDGDVALTWAEMESGQLNAAEWQELIS